jgi:membrane protein required for colicin V production
MNIFDAIVIGIGLVAVVMGYWSGLLRSLATIFGYLLAVPVAVALTPLLAPYLPTNIYALFFVVFLVSGVTLSAALRSAIGDLAGEPNFFDRVAGALLGAIRIGLLAVLMVLIFDRIIPPNLRPPWLTESQLRPYLAMAADRGVRKLPPDVTEYIDRMKQLHGL